MTVEVQEENEKESGVGRDESCNAFRRWAFWTLHSRYVLYYDADELHLEQI